MVIVSKLKFLNAVECRVCFKPLHTKQHLSITYP